MILADVHAHLDWFKNDELEGLISRAKAAGVKAVVTQGINPKSNRDSLELSKRYDIVRLAMGIYPDEGISMSEQELQEECKFMLEHRSDLAAVGEIGLDYKDTKTDDSPYEKTDADKERMRRVFFEMLKIAKKLDLPVLVHSRRAEKECIDLLEESRHQKIIMHCFGGNHKLVERVRQNRWHFSIPCSIVRDEHFQKIVRETPMKQLLTETDAPFLSPFRDRKNEPAFIVETVKMMASLKGLDELEASNMLFKNYQDLF